MSNLTSTDSMEPKKKYFVNYNQDSTSIAVGNKNGYRLYALNNVDDIEEIYRNDKEDTFIVERLFNSSLVAIVSLTALRTLKVCHYKKGTDICNYSYPNSILAVRMNRVRLIVCLEDSLIIHNIRDMKLLHTIKDTPPNPQGLCALSTSSDNCLLAYPGSTSNGEVQIFDAVELHAKTMIYAHDSPLGALAFNCKGTMLATASQKGTVIRVFKTHTGEKLFELRRGLKRCVDICSMAFSSGGLYLAVCSNTETVHVFRLMEEHAKDISSNSPLNTDDNIGGGGGGGTSSASASSLPSAGLLGNYWSTLQSMLPTQVTDVFNQGRAFATAYLPVSNVRSVVAIAPMQNQLRVLVATDEGILYVYNLTNEGGDMPLYRQHRLDDPVVVSKSPSNRATSDETSKTTEPGSALLGSYAGIVKGNPTGEMSESDKLREIAAATEQPTEGAQRYDQDYPPLGQNTD